MNIVKTDTPIWLRVTSILFTLGTVGAAVAGYIWAHNILWTLGVLNLIAAVSLVATNHKIYRPGIPLWLLVALDLIVWLVFAGCGWWGLLVIYVVSDLIVNSLTASTEEYLKFLEEN